MSTCTKILILFRDFCTHIGFYIFLSKKKIKNALYLMELKDERRRITFFFVKLKEYHETDFIFL